MDPPLHLSRLTSCVPSEEGCGHTNPSLLQCACKGRCINKQCKCRKGKVTCSENCQCDQEKCRNMENQAPAEVTNLPFLTDIYVPICGECVADRWAVNRPVSFRMQVRQKAFLETRRRFQTHRLSALTTPPSSSHPRALPLKRYTVTLAAETVLHLPTWPFSTVGVKRNWRHGALCCGPEAGQEAQLHRGGRGGGRRAGGENYSELPKEEEKTFDHFSEQFFLWMHSHQRGILAGFQSIRF